jgi:outer membrane protein assembly factor BamA
MKLVWALVLCSALAGAQTPKKKAAPPAVAKPPAPANQWPVQKLVVEGNRAYTADQVLAVAGLKVGQLAGRPEFEAARDRLVATGVFETVGYKFESAPDQQGYVATFQVTEVEPAFPLRFEELGVPDKDVEVMLRAKDPLFSAARLPATKAVMDRYVAWVQEYLASKNIQEKLAAKVTPLTSEQFAIVIRPARALPAVAAVTFSGNQVVPQGVLREAISGVAVGAPYTEAGFREVLNNAIRPVYEQRGRVRVAFPEIRAESASTAELAGIHVFVKVDEGVSYNLGNVSIDGPTPVEPVSLLKAGDFKTSDVANMDKVADGIDKIRKAVRHAGYLDVKVSSERKIDDTKKSVDIAVRIDAGSQYSMGKLTLVGLELDGEAEINRIWTMKEGKPLNPDYPDYFLNRIKEQGTFENLGKTKADLKVDEKRHVADVTLTFNADNPAQRPGRRGRLER